MSYCFDIEYLDHERLDACERLFHAASQVRGNLGVNALQRRAVSFSTGLLARAGLYRRVAVIETTIGPSSSRRALEASLEAARVAACGDATDFAIATWLDPFARDAEPGDLVIDRHTGRTFLLRTMGFIEIPAVVLGRRKAMAAPAFRTASDAACDATSLEIS